MRRLIQCFGASTKNPNDGNSKNWDTFQTVHGRTLKMTLIDFIRRRTEKRERETKKSRRHTHQRASKRCGIRRNGAYSVRRTSTGSSFVYSKLFHMMIYASEVLCLQYDCRMPIVDGNYVLLQRMKMSVRAFAISFPAAIEMGRQRCRETDSNWSANAC